MNWATIEQTMLAGHAFALQALAPVWYHVLRPLDICGQPCLFDNTWWAMSARQPGIATAMDCALAHCMSVTGWPGKIEQHVGLPAAACVHLPIYAEHKLCKVWP